MINKLLKRKIPRKQEIEKVNTLFLCFCRKVFCLYLSLCFVEGFVNKYYISDLKNCTALTVTFATIKIPVNNPEKENEPKFSYKKVWMCNGEDGGHHGEKLVFMWHCAARLVDHFARWHSSNTYVWNHADRMLINVSLCNYINS